MPLQRGQLLQQAFAHAQNTFQQINENKRAEQLFQLQKKKMEAAAEEAKMQRESLEQGVQGLQQAFGTPIGEMQFTDAAATEAPGGIGPDVQQAPPTQFTEQDQQQAVLEAGLNFLRSNQDDLGRKIVESTLFPDPEKSPQALMAKLAKTQAETQRIQADTLNKRIANEQAKIDLGTSEQFVGARNQLSDMFFAKAEQAKNPQEKFQFEMTAQSLKSAPDGKSMANVLEERFPTIEGASTAIQALLRNGMDPAGAVQFLEEQKAKGKLEGMSLGNDREALALTMFQDRFTELTQEQQRQVENELQDRRISAQVGKTGKLPIGEAKQTEVATLVDIRDLAKKAISLVTPELVGRLNAPWEQLKERFGQSDPEFTALSTTLKEITDIVARDRTGAVIGKDEVAFYGNLLGQIENNPKTLVNRLTELIERSNKRADRVITLSTTPGEDLRQQFGIGQIKADVPDIEREPTEAPPPAKPGERLSGDQRQRAQDILNKVLPGVLK